MVIFNKLPTYYAVGIATVNTGETTVTGTGTVWTSLQPGDLFGVHIGLAIPIAEVVSDTEFTLLFPWPGAAQTDADYCVQFIPRSVGVQEATRQLLLMLANGNLDAFAALLGGADKVPMFSGPGTLTLINKSELTSGVQADKQVADLAARAAYDNSPVDFKVLVSNTGDGRAALYTKLSNATADWSTPAYITGPTGADGVNPRGFYDNATAYAIDDLVYSGGSTWVAKIATTGNAPPTLPTTENTQWRLFARAGAAVNPRGDYAAGTAYEPLDAVLYIGSTWIAKIPTTGNAPPTLPTTSNAQWQLMAEKGMDGTGTGDVVGPAGGTANNDLAVFADATGKLIKKAPNNVVTNALLSQLTAPAIKGRLTTGTGNVEDLTPAQARQVLGGWEFIGSFNLAGLSQLDVTGLGAFKALKISVSGVFNAQASAGLRFSSDNGATFPGVSNEFRYTICDGRFTFADSSSVASAGDGDSTWFPILDHGGDTGWPAMAECTIRHFNDDRNAVGVVQSRLSTPQARYVRGLAAAHLRNLSMNALRFSLSASTVQFGSLDIEGIRG